MSKSKQKTPQGFWLGVVGLCKFMTAIAALALAATILVICADVVLRAAGRPIKGAYDLVRITGALAIACALPLTTAVKGHVAIEYFFQKLNRLGRLVVDSIMRLIMIGALGCATWACIARGSSFLRYRQVMDTIDLPVFWVPWVMAAAFGLTAIVVTFHLIHPGRELIRP
ncbi:MAG: TRAP transporter small permease [Kiritimatiellia bacterium]|jgi:TRAP-type C4-dicarboxylate transport system permease small subunit